MTPTYIDQALDGNRAFAAAGGHEGAVVFPELSLFVIAWEPTRPPGAPPSRPCDCESVAQESPTPCPLPVLA